MSHRSKREIAPPTPQALPPSVPWWGGAVKPGVAFPPSGEAMAVPSGGVAFPPFGEAMAVPPGSVALSIVVSFGPASSEQVIKRG